MDKKFRNRFVFLMILCAGFWFLNFNNQIQSFAAPSAKPSPAAQPAANKPQSHILPLVIQDLSLKSNQVWIAISHTGKGNLKAADYERIIVKVGGSESTGQGQWNLAQVDPGRVLLRENGKIEFNTKLILKKADRVTASISFGTWKIAKQENLNPAALTIATPLGSGPGSSKPAGPAQATRPAPPTPPPAVPRLGPVSGVTVQRTVTSSSLTRPTAPGGLTFAVPGAGQTVTAGDALNFILRFERSIAEGDVTLTLRRAGSSTARATATYHYRPLEGEWSLASNFSIPDHGLAAADDYFLHAVHAAGNTGVSPLFSIRLRGTEGLIRILKPANRDLYNPNMLMRVNYQMTHAAAGGLIRFEMFSQSTSRPVLSWTSDYHAQPAGAPQPVFIKEIKLPADLPFSNNYFIQATHAEGSGRSGTFSVAPLINHGGAEVVEDIAVTDIVKDTSGAIKVRARVTGARWPIWVECFPYPLGATSIILHPGDNEFTLDTTPFNGAGGDCSRNYTVRLDRYNRYAEANKTNNSLDKKISFLNRNGNLTIRNNTSLDYVGIPYDHPNRFVAFDYVLHYCGTEAFNVSGLVREVRQRGTTRSEPDFRPEEFDQSIDYEVWVTDFCNTLGMERRLDTVQPGQCVFIRILMENLAHQVDSDIILYLNDPAASWPGIRNPMTVHINFGG